MRNSHYPADNKFLYQGTPLCMQGRDSITASPAAAASGARGWPQLLKRCRGGWASLQSSDVHISQVLCVR